MTTVSFTAAGAFTWTVPPGVTSISYELWGGGGGGLWVNTPSYQDFYNAAGGGGGCATGTLTVTPGQTIYGFVGLGGAGNETTTTSGAGGGGQDSWLNISTNAEPTSSANGGAAYGGTGGLFVSGANPSTSGGGGTGKVGGSLYTGGQGAYGSAGGSPQVAGGAGANGGGAGGPGTAASSSGENGQQPGGGGGDWQQYYGNGGTGEVKITYTPPPSPSISSFSPTSGATAGGTSVTINGSNFTGITAVDFGSHAASSFTVNSSTKITATTPAEPYGDVTIGVTGTYGAGDSGSQFLFSTLPSISSLSPTSGPGAGGTDVTILGSGFTGAYEVNFGSDPATSFTVVSDSEITAYSPGGTGTVSVTVVTPGGTSAGSNFTYSNPGANITLNMPMLGM